MIYPISEKFVSIQGEGVYSGTSMAFIRFQGCSVGKMICSKCDTDFEKQYPWLGGGRFSTDELVEWVNDTNMEHVCLTGGEPLMHQLEELLRALQLVAKVHIETSGTVAFDPRPWPHVWLTVSPKPSYLPEVIKRAHEIKVIVGGLGPSDGWPALEDAVKWSQLLYPTPVFLAARNDKYTIDWSNVKLAQELVRQHPTLRLSVQLHKLLQVR